MKSTASDTEKVDSTPHIVALAIHGGAGGTTTPDMPDDLLAAYRRRLHTVLVTTHKHKHTTSLDAACHAVSQLEDSPLFNAGKGAVFDLAGHTVCESSLMTTQPGFNSNTIAVTGVRRTKNPILLSKVLLENNKRLGGHAFYSGPAAEEAGWKHGTERVSKHYYWTKRRWLEHKRGLDSKLADVAAVESESVDEQDACLPAYTHSAMAPAAAVGPDHQDQAIFDRYAHFTDFLPQGTVGAVALDSNGHLSVATSTGGKTNKYPGRIGDTPSVGSGFWADSWSSQPNLHRHRPSRLRRFFNSLLFRPKGSSKKGTQVQGIAISGTGDGDFFLRTNFASSVAHRIKYANVSFDQAIDAAMAEMVQLYGSAKGVGGAIILDRKGNAYFPLAASTMNRGLISRATAYKPKVAIFDDEQLA
ncbi:related to asparaginase 2 [Sporisorium reilianum SRZ2]|uniref:Related to asparaginase 2 n=2 Tax=Sporisorium reilianum TaxID=72558 RepID=E6ZR07_SPORE|nr:related to asparaginase 2 [Sporisorium reilianum SRZ2]SJX65313.1 related to asparaginase 2 [Sporisorium reilianum f. sp. reilianum]